jgi:hypothetical protein
MCKTNFHLILLAICWSGCFFSSNKKVKGNGKNISKNISVSQFNYVRVNNAIEVIATQDTTYAVKLVADENLIELIAIDTDYRYNLKIAVKKGYDLYPTDKIKVYISSPSLKKIEAFNASHIESKGILQLKEPLYCTASGASSINLTINVPTAEATLAGASRIKLKGEVKNLVVNASSASQVYFFDLFADTATVDLSGASIGELNVSKQLKAKAAGAAIIRYRGDPVVEKEESSAATITKQLK